MYGTRVLRKINTNTTRQVLNLLYSWREEDWQTKSTYNRKIQRKIDHSGILWAQAKKRMVRHTKERSDFMGRHSWTARQRTAEAACCQYYLKSIKHQKCALFFQWSYRKKVTQNVFHNYKNRRHVLNISIIMLVRYEEDNGNKPSALLRSLVSFYFSNKLKLHSTGTLEIITVK